MISLNCHTSVIHGYYQIKISKDRVSYSGASITLGQMTKDILLMHFSVFFRNIRKISQNKYFLNYEKKMTKNAFISFLCPEYYLCPTLTDLVTKSYFITQKNYLFEFLSCLPGHKTAYYLCMWVKKLLC